MFHIVKIRLESRNLNITWGLDQNNDLVLKSKSDTDDCFTYSDESDLGISLVEMIDIVRYFKDLRIFT